MILIPIDKLGLCKYFAYAKPLVRKDQRIMAAQTAESTSRIDAGFFFALLLLFAVLMACSGSGRKCTATLTYQGKTYTGADAKEEKAVSNACNKYCRDDDPEYEAMYRIWLDSPAGRAAGRPSKEEAILRIRDYWTTLRSPALTNVWAGGKMEKPESQQSVIDQSPAI
jgi:hypothetical protein